MNALRRTVLVVDDEEVVRMSYLRSLEGARCDVEAVPDGNEALRAMERNAFDLVMLDLRLPGTDGMTVLRTIKERWPESEVVVITGYPSIESAKEAILLGASDYLEKPIGPDEIIKAASSAMLHKEWALRGGGLGPNHANHCDNITRGERSRCAA
jgi:DNA-binding NtrC family response regulator